MSFHAESPNYELDFDPEKTSAIISNLLNNAIKFTPAGGEVSMNVRTMSSNLIIEIRDNGIGVPSNKIDKVFDRFYQADDSNTRKASGTGIGLSLTQELVNLLNGTIDVYSKPGVETIFTVRLPITSELKKRDSEPADAGSKQWKDNGNESTDSEMLPELHGKQTLLIVEDNEDLVDYMKVCFQSHFSILIANNGNDGQRLALKEIPDIIISDVMMPEMDGFELCKVIKEDIRTSHIPIILLTAKADISSRIEGLEQGADAYIVKPFNQQELLVRMQKLLELRKILFQRYSNGNGLELTADPVLQKEDMFFRKLNEIVQENIGDENFNIQVLCDEMAMSKSQLYRKFKALTNKSAAKYIRTIRMKKAKELLQNTSMNISEVAYEVGIKTPSTFSEVFKEEFGESPREFQNHLQSN
jgi:DNA-binding response OmpR family regulator/anti-sigma regulatory factor (Ser/Thr protein kinase)